jgi:hypothetical protein
MHSEDDQIVRYVALGPLWATLLKKGKLKTYEWHAHGMPRPQADTLTKPVTISESTAGQIPLPALPPPPQREQSGAKRATQSFDRNPLNRSMDRLLAALGLLDDALPLFAPAQNLPRAGVLLAVPALVASGLLSLAEKIYGSLAPSFYGLRTTLVAYVLLALLRIPRPEALKQYPPESSAALWVWIACRK